MLPFHMMKVLAIGVILLHTTAAVILGSPAAVSERLSGFQNQRTELRPIDSKGKSFCFPFPLPHSLPLPLTFHSSCPLSTTCLPT